MPLSSFKDTTTIISAKEYRSLSKQQYNYNHENNSIKKFDQEEFMTGGKMAKSIKMPSFDFA